MFRIILRIVLRPLLEWLRVELSGEEPVRVGTGKKLRERVQLVENSLEVLAEQIQDLQGSIDELEKANAEMHGDMRILLKWIKNFKTATPAVVPVPTEVGEIDFGS